jgi:hypothetical protein
MFDVQFVGDYFVLMTHVEAQDDEQAISLATEMIKDYYGWDLSEFDAEAEIRLSDGTPGDWPGSDDEDEDEL